MRRSLLALVLLAAACGPVPNVPKDGGPDADGGSSAPVDAGAGDAGDAGAVSDAGTVTDAGQPPPADGGCEGRAGRLDVNDVSFLFPLPPALGGNELFSLSTQGAKGMLLPVGLRGVLPDLMSPVPEGHLPDTRIISARFDPCFRSGTSGPCRPQLRLVGQPLVMQAGQVTTADATIHLFYELTAAELATAVTKLRALKVRAGAATDCRPLSLHPVMRAQGLSGPYATELKALLLELSGDAALSRVAVMQLRRPGAFWSFFAFNRVGSALVADPVPRTTVESQGFDVSDTSAETGFFGPEPTGSTLPLLVDRLRLQAAAVANVQGAVEEAYRVENPLLENPGTIDCVSCHLADRGRDMASRIRGVTLASSAKRYVSPGFDLSLVDAGRGIGSQRAFGYIGREPSFTQRTVNESAEVAKALNGLP